jgi:hypothetical protein
VLLRERVGVGQYLHGMQSYSGGTLRP